MSDKNPSCAPESGCNRLAKNHTETCACGKPGKPRFDNGLACGVHCTECFEETVAAARARSW